MPDYSQPVRADDDLLTIEEFKARVDDGSLIDDDGFGWPARNGFYAMPDPEEWVYPSDLSRIPGDATHILWANS